MAPYSSSRIGFIMKEGGTVLDNWLEGERILRNNYRE